MTLTIGQTVIVECGTTSGCCATVKELAPSSVLLTFTNMVTFQLTSGWFDLKTGKRLGDGDKQPYKFKVMAS